MVSVGGLTAEMRRGPGTFLHFSPCRLWGYRRSPFRGKKIGAEEEKKKTSVT